jgi:hypothetical protein
MVAYVEPTVYSRDKRGKREAGTVSISESGGQPSELGRKEGVTHHHIYRLKKIRRNRECSCLIVLPKHGRSGLTLVRVFTTQGTRMVSHWSF